MYKLTTGTAVIRISDGATIPADDANTDYQAYLSWKSAGNVPTPADVPTLAQHIDRIVLTIKREASQIHEDVAMSLTNEYQTAKREAQAYKDSGYTLVPVPASVTDWSTAKAPPWTHQQSADDILAQAANWEGAQTSIRKNRLAYAEQAKRAVTKADADTAYASWATFRNTIRAQLKV